MSCSRTSENGKADTVCRYEKDYKQTLAEVAGAVDSLYPDRADPPVPPARPLEQYAGTYFHPGYQYMRMELVDDPKKPGIKLAADRSEFSWKDTCEFAHVSAESWVMYELEAAAPNQPAKGFAGVEFKVGASGNVTAMGIGWRSDGSPDGWIWYDKVE